MSTQALNSIQLYKGQDIDKIFQCLQFQNKKVVNELMYELDARDLYDLATRLSLGIY